MLLSLIRSLIALKYNTGGAADPKAAALICIASLATGVQSTDFSRVFPRAKGPPGRPYSKRLLAPPAAHPKGAASSRML